jgi:hypothetical protein
MSYFPKFADLRYYLEETTGVGHGMKRGSFLHQLVYLQTTSPQFLQGTDALINKIHNEVRNNKTSVASSNIVRLTFAILKAEPPMWVNVVGTFSPETGTLMVSDDEEPNSPVLMTFKRVASAESNEGIGYDGFQIRWY